MATLQEVIDALNNVASRLGSSPSPGGDPAAQAQAALQAAEAAERRLAAAEANADVNASAIEFAEQMQVIEDATLAAVNARGEAGQAWAEAAGTWNSELADQQTQIQIDAETAHRAAMANIAAHREAANEAAKEQEEGIQRATGLAEGLGKSIGMAANFQQSLIGGWATMAELIDGDTEAAEAFNDQLRETFSAANMGATAFSFVLDATIMAAKAYDTATASFNKTTGAAGRFNEEMTDTTVGLASMGVGIEDAAAAYGALFSEMSNFTNLSKAERMVLGEVVSSLDGLGISAELTATNLEFLTKNMGMSAQQAADQQIKLAEFANTIGVAPAKMADEFKAAQPIMAKYGKEVGDKMFKKLAQTAKTTGIEMQSLLGIVAQFDTFEGAAQAAGKLNALLGGPLLNSVELLTANEADRVEMLRQAVSESGKSFSAMNRFERQAIANAAGITDMTEAARLFGTTDEEFAANAEEQANMAEMSAKAQSAQEKLNTLMMQFAAHVAPVVELFSDFLTGVLELVDSMGWFGKVLTTTILGLGLLQMAISAATIAANTQIGSIIAATVSQTAHALWTGISTIAIGLWTAVTWLATAAATALGGAVWAATIPVWLLVAAFVAVVAIVVAVIYYWDELTLAVQNTTNGMYDMWDVLLLVAAAIAAPFSITIAMIGAIVLGIKKIYDNWDAIVVFIKESWVGMTEAITGQIDKITQAWSYIGSVITGTISEAKTAWNNFWDGAMTGFKAFINSFIIGWNLLGDALAVDKFSMPSWLGGGSFGPWRMLDQVPLMAEGGTVTSSGLAVVGEKGPEIVKLPTGASVTPTKPVSAAQTSRQESPTTVILQLNEREFARAVVKVMNEKMNLRTG